MWQNVSKEILVGNGGTIFSVKVEVENRDKYNEVCEGINLILKGQNCENIKMKQENDRLKADNVKLSALVIKLKDDNDKLKADNERLKNANTNISGMYWEQKKKAEKLEEKVKNAMRFCDYLQTIGGAMESNLKHPISLFSSASTPNTVNCRCSIKPVENEPSEPENKTTNFDKIKELDVEGMAVFLEKISECCAGSSECEKCPLKDSLYCSKEKIADWLKKECTE